MRRGRRRYVDAAGYVSEALRLDVAARAVRAAGLDCAASAVGSAMSGLFVAVRSEEPDRWVFAVVEVAVAGIRAAAELPDPFRAGFPQAYLLVQRQAWEVVRSENLAHRRRWASVHEGLGVIAEEVVEFGELAVCGDIVNARCTAIRLVANAIRFLAELAPTAIPHHRQPA
ncbi:hypothetical protein D2E76_16020 [Mycobacteroides abscessus]|uniref:Uncharacterized protein n=2 Tax=Mycobacteroides abscessus TaxID=36809 RepID=A0ABD7HM02_9MYCO|nr:hypothetical protein D2E76_16020 [Mycobacteroides abscessus]